MNDAPRVTIAGGGLAGMTAALRLAERGYRVELYEQKPYLGGDLASRPRPDGTVLDVYPHMYLSWYRNFWRLMRDVGVSREQSFHAFSSVKQLNPGEFPTFAEITDMYSPWHLIPNLFSGVGPVADVFVFGYSTIDLLAERRNPTVNLDNVSVTGFLNARPYMTERAVKACDNFITMVWAIPSYLAAAEDYRAYLEYSVADHKPAYWLASGSAERRVIGPLTAELVRRGVEIRPGVQITSVSCTNGRVTKIGLQSVEFDPGTYEWKGTGDVRSHEVDELVLAVPPDALSALVRTGGPGHRVIDADSRLAEVARLSTQRIPILHVFFTRRRRHIPREPVGVFGSRLGLAFTDISQTWEGDDAVPDKTVLAVSASDPYALPDTDPRDDALAILRELAEYLDFEPGRRWGESPDIDWQRTRYEPNGDAQLFVNETGTDVWRPKAACEAVSNLAFAGDFCANRIGMTTIESAVTTGLEAAHAIVERRGLGDPVEIEDPRVGTGLAYMWARYAWAPYAFAAKAWSTGGDRLRFLRRLFTPSRPPRQRRDS